MSSLRISHHSRTIGTPVPGGEKPEASDDGAGFAAALDAAGGALKQAATLFGGNAGDAADGSPVPHKPGDNRTKTDSLDAALLVDTDAFGTPTVSPTPHKHGADHGSSGDSALSPAVSGSLVAVASDVPAAGPWTGLGVGSAASGGNSAAAPTVDGSVVAAGTGFALATGLVPTIGAGVPVPGPSNARLPIAADRATLPADRLGHAVSNSTDPGPDPSAATPSVSTPTPWMSVTEPDPAAVPTEIANGWAPVDALGAAPDASQVLAPAGPVSIKAPAVGAAAGAPALLAGLAQSVAPLTSGQPPGGNGGGAFGDAARDRFATIGAATASGDVAPLAAANGPDGTAAVAGAPGAAPTATAGPMGAGAIADQVAGHLMRMVSSGSHDMVLRLHPPELGDLTVRVAVNGRDVSAWFASPQPQVQTAISAAMGQLQTDLGNAGYNLNNAWVGGDETNARQQTMSSPPTITAPLSAAPAALSAAAVSRPAASGLNIYV